MAKSFCPGHITCFFRPAGDPADDLLARGSIGAGIRTSKGTFVEVAERTSSTNRITIDGEEIPAPVAESVLRQLAPERAFDVSFINELPCGEGFGMSASGSIALALCLCEMLELSEQRAFEIAHCAEITGGGGLGDVSAIYCLAHQPVRVKHGLPPIGEVIGTSVSFPQLSLAVLGPKIHTGNLLSDPDKYKSIVSAGERAVNKYLEKPSVESIYSISNEFSRNAGVESYSVSAAIKKVQAHGFHAAMCMLGNSIFTDVPEQELSEILGDVSVFPCSSTDARPRLIRKG